MGIISKWLSRNYIIICSMVS